MNVDLLSERIDSEYNHERQRDECPICRTNIERGCGYDGRHTLLECLKNLRDRIEELEAWRSR